MPNDDRVCTEIQNEIISRFSKVRMAKNADVNADSQGNGNGGESEDEFWAWFCGEIRNSEFKKCFLGSSRDDFYGSMSQVKEEYEKKCGLPKTQEKEEKPTDQAKEPDKEQATVTKEQPPKAAKAAPKKNSKPPSSSGKKSTKSAPKKKKETKENEAETGE